MKKVIKLNENDLKNLVKKVISEIDLGPWKLYVRDALKFGSKAKFSSVEDAVVAMKSVPNLLKSLDDVIGYAVRNKSVQEIDILVANVLDDFKNVKRLPEAEAIQQTKNFLNGYAKTRGKNNFDEIKNLAKPNVAKAETVLKLAPNPNWIYRWFSNNKNGMIARLFENVHKLENVPFNPKNVKVINHGVLDSVEGGVFKQRPVIEIQVKETGDNFLVYSSTGTGAPELKQAGDWQLVAGWMPQQNNPKEIQWYIKSEATTQLTKGLNKWATDLANFIKKNGEDALGK